MFCNFCLVKRFQATKQKQVKICQTQNIKKEKTQGKEKREKEGKLIKEGEKNKEK